MTAVFEVSLTFFILALAGIVANTRDVAGFSMTRTRWFTSLCIVFGIVSLLL
ncbi:MAG: DUF1328 domain-containing protein [Euryarchaeota archaeon]|jgi:hypothetical protein|nr:DUF1328 domain-containing protein [Euryarchaeota archaeon]